MFYAQFLVSITQIGFIYMVTFWFSTEAWIYFYREAWYFMPKYRSNLKSPDFLAQSIMWSVHFCTRKILIISNGQKMSRENLIYRKLDWYLDYWFPMLSYFYFNVLLQKWVAIIAKVYWKCFREGSVACLIPTTRTSQPRPWRTHWCGRLKNWRLTSCSSPQGNERTNQVSFIYFILSINHHTENKHNVNGASISPDFLIEEFSKNWQYFIYWIIDKNMGNKGLTKWGIWTRT